MGRAAGRLQPRRLDLLIVGFAVGAFNMVAALLTPWVPALADKQNLVPVPPVAAFIVGFVLYFIIAKIGLTSPKLDMPATAL